MWGTMLVSWLLIFTATLQGFAIFSSFTKSVRERIISQGFTADQGGDPDPGFSG